MKKYLYLLLISLYIFNSNVSQCLAGENKTFASLAPALTEIMYAIGAQDALVVVSTECNYPKDVVNKEIVGNVYYLNTEKLLKNKPDYVLSTEGNAYQAKIFQKIGVKPVVFEMNSVKSIYDAIYELGKLTGNEQNASILVKNLDSRIANLKSKNAKRILYLIQTNPAITIGNKTFLADVIRKSGQISVTDDLDEFYPAVSEEYLLKSNPDLIIVSFKSDDKRLRKLFPNTKIIYLENYQNDFINRPASRVYLAVKFFAEL